MLVSLCLLKPYHQVESAVEGGALVKGSTLSNDSAVIPEASGTSKAVKWSSTDLDPSTFEFDSAHPTRLKIKSAGDYFLTFNCPISENVRGANQRSQVHFFVKKNGSTNIPQANARSTYVRHDSGHSESSGHMHLLLSGLSANDYVEVLAKSFDLPLQIQSISVLPIYIWKKLRPRALFF